MKRTLVGCLTVLVPLASPRASSAWDLWGWLQEMSGPGPFTGKQIDVRLWCFGGTPTSLDSLRLAQLHASELKQTVEKIVNEARTILNLPKSLETALDQLGVAIPAGPWDTVHGLNESRPDILTVKDASDSLRELSKGLTTANQDLKAKCDACGTTLVPLVAKAAGESAKLARTLMVTHRTEVNALGDYSASSAVLLSACRSKNESAPFALGVVFRSLHFTDQSADAADRYAGGNPMELVMLGPALTWHPIGALGHPKLDVLDVGIAGGAYWFSSSGEKDGAFSSFSGFFLEPLRLDFHAPSWVQNNTRWAWILAIPIWQHSLVVFPTGFEANAFGPNLTGKKAAKLPGELLRSRNALFFNLEPIVDNLVKWVR